MFAALNEVHPGILCASRPCHRASLPWHSVKDLDIGDGVYIFVLAQLAASYECAGRIRRFVFEFILQTRNLCGNGNRLSASNTRHSTIALHHLCNHLNLTKGICRGLGELEKSSAGIRNSSLPKVSDECHTLLKEATVEGARLL